MRRHTQHVKRSEMHGRWVPDIALPAVAWVSPGKFRHEPVAKHLRYDGSAGDRIDRLIATDHRRMWPDQFAKFARAAPVNESEVGRRPHSPSELRYGASHGAMRCCARVEAFNLARRRRSDADRYGNLSNLLRKVSSAGWRQHL
jgi:hypothetical protein